MKCKLCKNKTTWDASIGRENFIVCNDCWHKMADLTNVDPNKVLSIVIIMGNIKAEHKK